MNFKARFLLAKIEATYDTDPSPDNTNTILTTGIGITPYDGETVSLEYDRPDLGASEQINVNPNVGLSFGVMAAGAIAAGKPPGYDCLLRACGMVPAQNELETDTAVGPGGGNDTIELGTSASAVDDFYNDLYIVITGGTGIGEEKRATDYVGSTKIATVESDWIATLDGTTVYSVKDKVTYTPVSEDFESVTGYFLRKTQQHAATGIRGNVGLTLAKGQAPIWNFDNLMGAYISPETVSEVTPDFSLFTDPVPVTNANTGTVTVDGYSACLESFTVNHGNNVVRRNVPNCQETLITDRNITGTIVIGAPALGTKDYFASLESHEVVTKIAISITHGTAIGNIIAVSAPTVQLSNISEVDLDGQLGYSMDFLAIPSASGDDEISYEIR